MRIGNEVGAFSLGVMMSESDAVRYLDTKEEARRDRVSVFPDDIGPGQNSRVALEQGPEPLINLDSGVMPALLPKVVATLSAGVDQPFPGLVFPAAGADSDLMCTVHSWTIRSM